MRGNLKNTVFSITGNECGKFKFSKVIWEQMRVVGPNMIYNRRNDSSFYYSSRRVAHSNINPKNSSNYDQKFLYNRVKKIKTPQNILLLSNTKFSLAK